MIFGFNTDTKVGDTVYHVQSEARQNDLLLQTQVFVRGQCIGKRAASYADQAAHPGFTDEHMHELLKTQHRLVLEAVRGGKLEGTVGHNLEIQDTDGQGLAIRWVNSDAAYTDSAVVMKFVVTDNGAAVEGARLTSRLALSSDAPAHSQAATDSSGAAEMKLVLDAAGAHEAAILVQAQHGEKSATRKFRLRKAT
jgi:hypothetical protein